MSAFLSHIPTKNLLATLRVATQKPPTLRVGGRVEKLRTLPCEKA